VSPPRRVVLVGFMAAGKTSVGEALARRLGWGFVDVDRAVEARSGASIAELFAGAGEAAFRELEAEAARAAIGGDEVVVATGGGWPSSERSGWPSLPAGTLSVWLRVGPEEAVRRAGAEGIGRRPRLSAADPLAAAESLLAEREPSYRLAALHVQTGGRDPESIAADLARAVRGARAGATDHPGGTNGP